MASNVSPGVYWAETDFSLYIPRLSSQRLAIVTTASRGDTNKRHSVASEGQLIQRLGFPSATHKGLLAAREYLRQGNLLDVVRVAGYGESSAVCTVDNLAGSANAATFTASSTGSWANSGKLSVQIAAGSVSGTYKVVVRYNGQAVKTYDAVTLSDTSDDFIETRMASDDYVSVSATGETTFTLGTYNFVGGDDGADVTQGDVIGTISGQTKSGLKLFADSEEVDVNTLCVPGESRSGVVAELISIAESRGDCMSLIDPPFGLDVDEAIDWHNGVSSEPNAPGSALNSSFAAAYWPWCKTFDSYSNSYVWTPPSGFAAQVFALTDRDYAAWFAPAGMRRGRLPSVIETEYSPTLGDRERMYGGSTGGGSVNALNPIPTFTGDGTMLYGQRTLQRASTALDRISTRRALLYIRKVVATAVRYIVFEPNDERMWNDFKGLVVPFLRTVKAGRGLRDYRVIMDQTTNTDDVVSRNEAYARILLKAQPTAEVINIDATLVPQGARFEEFLTTQAT